MISKSPKANITLEKDLIEEIKKFIHQKKKEDNLYPYRTPTALIREAVRSYIQPDDDSKSTDGHIEEIKERLSNIEESNETEKKFLELRNRIDEIERSRETIADEEQNIYVRCVAMLIDIFDHDLNFFESFKIARSTLDESNITPLEFRDWNRLDIEKYFLEHLSNPPEGFANKAFQEYPLFRLLMMFLFLCNLGYTRKQDIIDPASPMSSLFLETLKKMNESNQ